MSHQVKKHQAKIKLSC